MKNEKRRELQEAIALALLVACTKNIRVLASVVLCQDIEQWNLWDHVAALRVFEKWRGWDFKGQDQEWHVCRILAPISHGLFILPDFSNVIFGIVATLRFNCPPSALPFRGFLEFLFTSLHCSRLALARRDSNLPLKRIVNDGRSRLLGPTDPLVKRIEKPRKELHTFRLLADDKSPLGRHCDLLHEFVRTHATLVVVLGPDLPQQLPKLVHKRRLGLLVVCGHQKEITKWSDVSKCVHNDVDIVSLLQVIEANKPRKV
mmetsp:Transcript_24278/g.41131  ORF Transcript_24278/g.41131 Transcript_24278/m.41131 type:complete len:259 (+) Transcript_24278:72-848(+)